MGFTVANYPQERFTCPLAYVCFNAHAVQVHKMDDNKMSPDPTTKYMVNWGFAVYYSEAERLDGKRPIEMKNVSARYTTLPADLSAAGYTLAKAEFPGLTIADV